MKGRSPVVLMLLACVIGMATRISVAQDAQLTGRVIDSSGGVLVGATVRVVCLDREYTRVVVTNGEGYYIVSSLPPGIYRVEAQAAGFRTATYARLQLGVQQSARADFTLELGEVEQEITVTWEAPILEGENASLGKLVDETRVQSLPLLGRNPYALVTLVPGARPSTGLNDLPVDQITTSFVVINGARANQNAYLLDGAPNTAAAHNQPVINANPDTIQEFKVETNNFNAQYGRAAGGVFNVVSKSGTNEFHGSLYDYLRNDVLNANNFFSNRAGITKPSLRFNQFGGTAGGPIRIPRIYDGSRRSFFFASYEGVRFSQGGTYVGTVPTRLQRQGDFSQTRDGAGRTVIIYDPLTTRQDPVNPGRFLRDPFPGNIIPTDRWSVVARKLLEYMPLPNAQGNISTGTGNYVCNAVSLTRKDTSSVRIDHQLNASDRISGRYNYDRSPLLRANVYGSQASPTYGPQIFIRQNLGLQYSFVQGSSRVGTLLFGFTRLMSARTPHSIGFDYKSIGFPESLNSELYPRSFPSIIVSGMGGSFSLSNTATAALLGTNAAIRLGDTAHSVLGHITQTWGRHTFKLGGEGRLIQPNFMQVPDAAIQFSFSPQFTQGPDPAKSSTAAGHGFASFLTGVATGSYTSSLALAMRHIYWAGFLQDDIKVHDRLTLNLGLRYEYESPRSERYNRLTNFDPDLPVSLQGTDLNLRGALVFAGVGRLPRGQWEPDRNNLAPRLGLAYRAMPKLVVRGGAGAFFAAITGIGRTSSSFGTSGFEATTIIPTTADGVTPATFLDNPYPNGINHPSGSSLGPLTLLGQAIRFSDRNIGTPYSLQWNLDVQVETKGRFTVEAGYAASRGLKLQDDLELNQLPGSVLKLGNALLELVPNPFYGQIASGPLSASTISRARLMRPFPQFDSIVATNSTWAASSYHAAQLSVQRMFAGGGGLMVSYTFSKLLDQATGPFAGESLGAGAVQVTNAVQDFHNLAAERSVSVLDAPHRLVVNGIWQIPIGPNRRWQLASWPAALLGDWEASAIATQQSGGPLALTSATNTTYSLGGNQRPNMTGINPALSPNEKSVDRWLNTKAFSAPLPFSFGNAPRTLADVRNDGLVSLDVSLAKSIPLSEEARVTFRAEFFNILNTVRFAPPDTNYGSPRFGAVTNQANQPRVIQFALRFAF